jgi:DNA polymerase I-like protein with 3'-5' exonuclease and polymerase domains
MLASYATGDPHMQFAVLAGAAPEGAKQETHREVRKKFKAVNLATNYGQTAHGLAQQTGMYLAEAEALLGQHRRLYPDYYGWQERYVRNAFARGSCHTIAGWRRKVARSDNSRSVANFPIQGCGGDLMRLSVIYLSRSGLKLLATVHDGFLIECRRSEIREVRDAIDSALRRAVTQLLPGCPMTWTTEVDTDRYHDKDGKSLWDMIYDMLHVKV